MLKKVLKNLCLTLLIIVSTGLLSACCARNQDVSIVFKDVDPNMGVANYVDSIKYSETCTIEFIVPEGYDHTSMTITMGERELEYEVTYADPNIAEGYEYATEKTIKVVIEDVIQDLEVVFDMSQVRQREFEITLSEALFSKTKYIPAGEGDTEYQLSLLTIAKESTLNLTKIDESIILNERVFNTQKIVVPYGEYIVACFDKTLTTAKDEIPILYSEVNHFTNANKISSMGSLAYSYYNVATRGNSYYNRTEDGFVNNQTRLYYIGKIQEDINLYDNVPGFVEEKGFTLENDKNKFSLLTNKSDYNSDLLSISVYAPTELTYDSSNDLLDKIENVTLSKIEKYDSNGEIKDESILYEFNNRYDVYNMYIGSNRNIDPLLTQHEKAVLPDCLYVKIESDMGLENLNFNLLYYEKQKPHDIPFVVRTDYIESEKGGKYIKIEKSDIEDFLLARGVTTDAGSFDYTTGNAILYIEIDWNKKNELKAKSEFPYYEMSYPITYNGKVSEFDYDYKVEFYILNADGSKDYGFIDMQNYYNLAEDVVYFRADKLFVVEDGEYIRDTNRNFVYKNTLYFSIYGPEYNDYYSPVIQRIDFVDGNDTVVMIPGGLLVEDAKEFNGYIGYKIPVFYEKSKLMQKRITVSPTLTSLSTIGIDVNFDSLTFNDVYTDAIYVTNNANFTDGTSFTRIDDTSKFRDDLNIRFSQSSDIYYFIASDENIDFDIYVGKKNSETGVYEGTKDNARKISASKQLLDIAGNAIVVTLNGRPYNVMVKYQSCDVYALQGSEHFAYN